MSNIIIDVFDDCNNAKEVKDKMEAMGKSVELIQCQSITVNEYAGNKPSLKYEKDGNLLYILIAK